MLTRYPVKLTRLESWVRARYQPGVNSTRSPAG